MGPSKGCKPRKGESGEATDKLLNFLKINVNFLNLSMYGSSPYLELVTLSTPFPSPSTRLTFRFPVPVLGWSTERGPCLTFQRQKAKALSISTWQLSMHNSGYKPGKVHYASCSPTHGRRNALSMSRKGEERPCMLHAVPPHYLVAFLSAIFLTNLIFKKNNRIEKPNPFLFLKHNKTKLHHMTSSLNISF